MAEGAGAGAVVGELAGMAEGAEAGAVMGAAAGMTEGAGAGAVMGAVAGMAEGAGAGTVRGAAAGMAGGGRGRGGACKRLFFCVSTATGGKDDDDLVPSELRARLVKRAHGRDSLV